MHLTTLLLSATNSFDITALSQVIGSLGFPILASCALFYYIQKQQEGHRSEIKELTICVDNIKEALNNNTLILQRVLDKLELESEVK